MLTKENIKTYKLANSVLEIAATELKILKPPKAKPITIYIEILETCFLASKSAAEALAKRIGLKLVEDKNIGNKIDTLTEAQLKDNNFFLIFHETTDGSYLKAVWSGN